MSRVTTDPDPDTHPRWTPDGQRVVFYSARAPSGLYAKAADGTGDAEAIRAALGFPTGWTPDGSQLVFWAINPATTRDVGVVSLEGGSDAQWPLRSEFSEAWAVVSPDGRWIAYSSTRSGRFEVYMERFPEMGDRRQISSDGGDFPLWAPDGSELFYVAARTDDFWSVPIDLAEPVTVGTPRRLFDWAFSVVGGNRTHDLAPDGDRFLMLTDSATSEDDAVEPRLIVVEHWVEELTQRVPID